MEGGTSVTKYDSVEIDGDLSAPQLGFTFVELQILLETNWIQAHLLVFPVWEICIAEEIEGEKHLLPKVIL